MARRPAVRQKDQYDSPWKTLIDQMLPPFLAFFFPMVYKDIDWDKPPVFLDKELQKISRDGPGGPNTVDKLVKVWLLNGTQVWLNLHIELQSQYEKDFAKRVFRYQERIWDRYEHPVVSLVVLADDREGWKPDSYGFEHWGAGITSRFLVSKLLEWKGRWDELEQSQNPFSVAVMSHLKTMETRNDPSERAKWRFQFFRRLCQGGFLREHVVEMLRFMDWLMVLPPDLELEHHALVEEFEEESNMEYVTSWQRRGALQSTREDIVAVLDERWGEVSPSLVAELDGIDDPVVLKRLLRRAVTVNRPEELLNEELTGVA